MPGNFGQPVHWRIAGELIACGAPHRSAASSITPFVVCCTPDLERVTCDNCVLKAAAGFATTSPSGAATSRPPAPVTGNGGANTGDGPGTVPVQIVPGMPDIYLRLGGKLPGLYVDGKRVL